MNWDPTRVKQELRGPGVLVMAPFNADLSLNRQALKRNIRYILDGGLGAGQGFLICPCGTGEYLALSPEEHRQMVEVAVDVTDGQLPVVAGVAGCDINEVIGLAENARKAGAKYIMVSPPFYDLIDQDSIYNWYRIIGEAVDVGIMVYDQSWRNLGTYLGLPLIERLAGIRNVVSLKYGSDAILKDTLEALDRFSDRFAIIDNSFSYISVQCHMRGETGFISSPASWWPEFELRFFQQMEEGKYAEAERGRARIAPYSRLFFGEFFTGPHEVQGSALIKASLEYVGLHGGPVRPPFRELTPEEKSHMFAIMDRIGVRKLEPAGRA